MRSVILHYHLFKNAGTSLDRVLQRNFGTAWRDREFALSTDGNTPQVAQWIRETPEAIAFSSHTAIGALPVLADIRLFTILFLRDPIDRIVSAYTFERNQKSDSAGAVLAKTTDLAGYVRARLAVPGDRQCLNFQTHRLAALVPGPAPELDRARQALRRISFAGLVDHFEASGRALETQLQKSWPAFRFFEVHANRASQREARNTIDPDLHELLRRNNTDDLAILAEVGKTPVVNGW